MTDKKYWTLPESILWIIERNQSLLDAIPTGKENNMTVALSHILGEQGDTESIAYNNDIQSAIESLKLSAENGNIKAYGINSANGKHSEINDTDWLSATLKGNNGNIRLTLDDNTVWTDIRFESKSVINEFPAPSNRRPRGRSIGDGVINDTKYLDYMKKLIDTGKAKSPRQASIMAVKHYGQKGQSIEADEKRLQRKYIKLYSS